MLKDKNIEQALLIDDKNKPGEEISTFRIAATYIGTVVGAGFASGQEVLQFFGYYGLGGFAGLALTTLVFVLYGYIILKLGLELNARSHLKVIQAAGGRWLGFVIDYVIIFFLFGALTAMIAGSGAIFQEQFRIPSIWGNIIMALFTLGTTLLGISGVISAISFVVPLLLTGVFSLTILTILENVPFTFSRLNVTIPGEAPVPTWFLSAIVYASYNIVLAVAVLAPLGAKIKKSDKLKTGSILGGLGLGIGAATILLALLLNMPQVTNFEIPMVYIASQFSPWIQYIYSGILLAEIYTTAVGNLFGFGARLTDPQGPKYKWYVIGTTIVALIASQFGFTNLVHYLYPAVGYAGFLLLAGLTLGIVRQRW